MSRYIYLMSCCILCTFLNSSCSGSSDDGPEQEDTDNTIQLVSDRTEINADGVDLVKLSVQRGDEDLTARSVIQMISKDGTVLSQPIQLERGATGFSTGNAGEYEFRASYYEGETLYSENTITIKAKEVGKEKFFHRTLGMQFTSAGCHNCPALSRSIKQVLADAEYADRLIPISFHMDFSAIKDVLSVEYTSMYMKYYGQNGLPGFWLDLRKDRKTTNSASEIRSMITNVLDNNRTTCGIAMNVEYDPSSRKGTANVRILSESTSEDYRILSFVIESGIEAFQIDGSENSNTYIHDHVVRELLSQSYLGDKLKAVVANEEKNSKIGFTLQDEWNAEQVKIVVAVLSSYDGGASYVVNNVASCGIGKTSDYKYN